MDNQVPQEDNKIKYELKSIGGGYSGGSNVGYDDTTKKIRVEVNLYGGSKKQAGLYNFNPPESIAHLVTRFLQARQDASQDSVSLQQELDQYKVTLAQEIDKEVVTLLQQVDQELETAIKNAIRKINYKF